MLTGCYSTSDIFAALAKERSFLDRELPLLGLKPADLADVQHLALNVMSKALAAHLTGVCHPARLVAGTLRRLQEELDRRLAGLAAMQTGAAHEVAYLAGSCMARALGRLMRG